MTGVSLPGVQRFVAKEGVAFGARLTLHLHSDELEMIDTYKREDESRADYIRAALREKMLRDGGLVPVRAVLTPLPDCEIPEHG